MSEDKVNVLVVEDEASIRKFIAINLITGLELGADDYMVKPFYPREQTARIRAILRRAENAKTSGSTLLSCKNLQMNLNAQKFY